jgi:regulator of PEP synthase PpsR (kinase-PPPase family)
VTERPIFLLSDSTGETAERLVRAALVQFPQLRVRLRTFTRVRDSESVVEVFRHAREAGALVVYTLAGPDLRDIAANAALDAGVECIDLIGPVLGKLSLFLSESPAGEPAAQMPLSEEYFRRVEALEFAVKSDDGKEPRNLRRADLVLVGPSRTSKTPLSTYLAGRGLRVANVPLVNGVQPPDELFDVPQARVIGLRIDPDQLFVFRAARLRQLGLPVETMDAARSSMVEELDYATRLYDERKWYVVDVSGRAIEETATIILEYHKSRVEQRGFTLPPAGAPR